jgi:hypothetical protein
MVLFVLQNGYHSEKYQYRNLEEWSVDLHRSHTGRRLIQYIPQGVEYKVINSTPIVGTDVNSCLDPDLSYMQEWITRLCPDVICACGYVAQKACDELNVKHIKAPHPAWRALSKLKISEIRNQILNAVSS